MTTLQKQKQDYYQRNKAKVLLRSKKYYEANKDKHRVSARKYKLRTRYGLTWDQYQAMLVAQDHKCAICQNTMAKACVDHCHKSGKVRKILCDPCNTAIGLLQDNPYILMSARKYLVEHM